MLAATPLLGLPLPICTPHPSRILRAPLLLPLALIAIAAAITTYTRYNGVTVLRRKINEKRCQNKAIAAAFTSVAVTYILEAVRYILNSPDVTAGGFTVDFCLCLGSIIFRGLTAVAFTAGLEHQRRYRSSVSKSLRSSQRSTRETTNLLPSECTHEGLEGSSASLCRSIIHGNTSVVEAPHPPTYVSVKPYLWIAKPSTRWFMFIYCNSLLILYVSLFASMRTDVVLATPYIQIYTFFYAIQYLPTLASLCLLRNNTSKFWFFMFFTLWSFNMIPPSIFYRLSGNWANCINNSSVSGMDLILGMNAFAMLSLLWAIRREFTKFKDECVWRTVTQIQDSFEYPV